VQFRRIMDYSASVLIGNLRRHDLHRAFTIITFHIINPRMPWGNGVDNGRVIPVTCEPHSLAPSHYTNITYNLHTLRFIKWSHTDCPNWPSVSSLDKMKIIAIPDRN
jgi:hypothetical protein